MQFWVPGSQIQKKSQNMRLVKKIIWEGVYKGGKSMFGMHTLFEVINCVLYPM